MMERVFNGPGDANMSPAWVIRTLILVVVFSLPLASWYHSIGGLSTYFHYDLPPGQVPYILMKLAGLYLFALLWLQVLLGVLKGDTLSRYLIPQWSLDNHRWLGIATLILAWSHFLLFFIAVSLRKEDIAYGLLLPQFDKGIYFIAVSLGWFALIGMTFVAFIGHLRRKSAGIWVYAHRLSFVVFGLALIHAQMVGSEAQSDAWFYVHSGFAITVLIALIRRMTSGRLLVR